jgi:hypothetical protein
MSRFEDHLWREVEREHGDDLAQMSRPPAGRRQRPSTAVIAGTGVGAVAVIAGLAFVLGGASTSPAFAVTRHQDGTVTVSISRASGIAGANAKLRRLGIRAQVMRQVPVRCGDGRPAPIASPPPGGFTGAHWVIYPSQVPAGRTLALTPPGRNSGHPAGSATAASSGSGTATSVTSGTATSAASGTVTSGWTQVYVRDATGGGARGKVWSCLVPEQNKRLSSAATSDNSGNG